MARLASLRRRKTRYLDALTDMSGYGRACPQTAAAGPWCLEYALVVLEATQSFLAEEYNTIQGLVVLMGTRE